MKSSNIKMQPLRSAEEAVTEALREAIHNGDLKPGQRLSQSELSEQLGVSRVPLRDALRKLEGEALVRMDGRRGTWVSSLSVDAIREVYEIRIMLEECCTIYAVEKMTDQELAKILDLMDKMDKAEEHPEKNGFSDRREFYSQLYSYADRPMMRDQILLLRDNVGRYHHFKDHGHGQDDHNKFRDAMVKRDGIGAARALKRHLEDARDDLLRHIESQPTMGK